MLVRQNAVRSPTLERIAVAPIDDGGSVAFLFTFAIMVWAVDFKAASSGQAAALQGTILSLFIGASFLLTVICLRRGINAGTLWLVTLTTSIFIIDSAAIGLIHGQPGYDIFVNTIPSFLYACTGAITFMTLRAVRDERSVLNIVRAACLIFSVTHLMVTILTRGQIDAATARYEVLSSATVPSLAIIAIGLMRRLAKLDFVIIVLNIGVALLSVTRTLLSVLVLQIGAVFIARPSAALKRLNMAAMIWTILAFFAVLGADYLTGTGLADRWIQRLTVSQRYGADPTALSRMAESRFMLERFESSPETFLFGNGLAALTSLTGPEARRAASIAGAGSFTFHSIGFGHENYVSILFTAGLLGGGGLIFILWANGVQSLLLMRRIQDGAFADDDSAAHIGLWGSLIVIGDLVVGLLKGTMADRGVCVWLGVGTGMLYWARYRLRAPVTL